MLMQYTNDSLYYLQNLQEQWHVYWSEKHGLYTLYLNLPNAMALASNWREAGVHAKDSFNAKDFPTLDYCAIQLQNFPSDLNRYDWDAWNERIPLQQRVFQKKEGVPMDPSELS